MPNVFQNLVSCKRVFRELRMLCFFKHDNVRRHRTSGTSPVWWIRTEPVLFVDLCRFCRLWTSCSLHRSTALRRCILSDPLMASAL